jgi:hypothetical protein
VLVVRIEDIVRGIDALQIADAMTSLAESKTKRMPRSAAAR